MDRRAIKFASSPLLCKTVANLFVRICQRRKTQGCSANFYCNFSFFFNLVMISIIRSRNLDVKQLGMHINSARMGLNVALVTEKNFSPYEPYI